MILEHMKSEACLLGADFLKCHRAVLDFDEYTLGLERQAMTPAIASQQVVLELNTQVLVEATIPRKRAYWEAMPCGPKGTHSFR